MKFPVADISEHLPLSTRRVVIAAGRACSYETRIGLVEGLADGKVLLRDLDGANLGRTHYELSPEEARDVAHALMSAAFGVEQWQRMARGYYRVRARREGRAGEQVGRASRSS